MIAPNTSPDTALVTALRNASRGLIDQRSLRDRDTLLGQLVEAAVDVVGPADGGGISRTDLGSVQSSHATTPAIARLDQLQSDLGEGPCIDAALHPPEDGILLVRDLAGEALVSWPNFVPHAVEAGFGSMLSLSLLGPSGGSRSALNLYSATTDAFDWNAVVTGGLFASHAGALLYGADNAAHLGAALATRDLIGQAKGILMERFSVADARAFELLVKSSQDTNMKLIDVARWLVSEAGGGSGATG